MRLGTGGTAGLALGLLGLLGLAACTSAPRAGPSNLPPPEIRTPAGEESIQPLSTGSRVVARARSLLATPYRYGGDGPGGFDCSGLVTFLYREIGLPLPRTAEAQAAAGRWVAPDELRPGDLVFFGKSRDKPLHVGVVSSPPGHPLAMIHASSSRGVVETKITANPYWLPRLKFGRRVLTGTPTE